LRCDHGGASEGCRRSKSRQKKVMRRRNVYADPQAADSFWFNARLDAVDDPGVSNQLAAQRLPPIEKSTPSISIFLFVY
jgi:hypothetical protein